MERRTIGAAALAVGAVGLGCMPMSWAYSASRQRGTESLKAVHRALDLGSTLLDTADMYGPFTNELLLGRVLKERRSDAFVSTKVGLLVGEQHIVANGRPGYVRRACDASLRRLQTDVIRQLERVQQVFPVSAVQAELSVWSPEALESLLPWCAERAVGFLAAMPLGNGFLTGTLTPGQGFEPEDVRARHPRFTAEMMAANQPIVAGLRRTAARHGENVTPAQVALAWVLAQGRHVIPVPGTKQEHWVTENADAAGLRLTADDLTELGHLPTAQGSWD
ncbi:aldo/keto reductase [Streptomyces sp. NPDC001698]|uniref:aldo/keto reductase n=1 Tax=Streptomyces sp. NPDC001698 TaxID=3364601 RepID=UPI0036A5CDC0